MASCQTARWGSDSDSPYVKLTVTISSSTATSATLSWTLQYITEFEARTSVPKSYSVEIAGSTVKSGTYDINKKVGTFSIASGTKTITKTNSAQTISFGCSMAFNLTWSGTYGGTKSASGSISVPAITTYTVSYNANGGSGAPSSQSKRHGTNITLSSTKPTRTGYTFQGWGTSASDTSVDYAAGATYSNNASVTLYAIWKIITYTVSYDANGGTGAPSAQTKTYGVNITLSSTKPTRTGYTFQGWGTSSGATSASYQPGATYSNNAAITLYAVWKIITYTVSYNANGGSGAPSAQTKTYGQTLTLSSTRPTRTNYTFQGWGTSASSTSASYQPGGSYTNNAAITLYAVWKLSYKKPRITSFSVDRCNSGGTATDEGTYARVNFSWACDYTVSSITIQWKSITSSTWTSTTVSASGTSGSVSKVVGGGALAVDHTYDIYVAVSDSGGTTPKTTILEGSKFIIDLLYQGLGIAIGKAAEMQGVCDIGFQTKFTGGILQPVLGNGVDLNTVTTPNTYSGNAASTSAYVNCPITTSTSFTLEVISAGGGGQIMQRITSCTKGAPVVYIRHYYSSAWGDWITM